MKAVVPLTHDQVAALTPLIRDRHASGTCIVAAVMEDQGGWALIALSIPADHREAVRAAVRGELKLPRQRRAKAESPNLNASNK